MIEMVLDESVALAVLATTVTGIVLLLLIRDPWVRNTRLWKWPRGHHRRRSRSDRRPKHRRAA
jgi:hypothetical protein